MNTHSRTFFERKRIHLSDIMYIVRSDNKSVIHLENGLTFETFIPIKKLISDAGNINFNVVNKGIALSPKYIARVENNIYYMTDGVSFPGRVHIKPGETDRNREKFSNSLLWQRFEVFEKSPLAFCVIEVVFDKNGRAVDFIFRYCNKAMEQVENVQMDDMINHSFYEVFKDGDRKWLITYADVAINGTQKVIEGYSPEIDKTLRIFCYQPKQNFCACALVEV